MFDLFRNQGKATRYLLIVILSAVALSMIVTLIPGFGSGFGSGNQQILAEVGDATITAASIHKLIQMQMRQQQFPRDMAELLVPQMVTQYVGEMATVYQAKKMGFMVSDEELIAGIRKLIPQLFQNGQFVGTDAYQQYLTQMNMTIPEFEENVRKQILLSKLQGIVFEGIIVTPKEIEAEYQHRGEKAKLEVVKFESSDYTSQVSVSAEEIASYYKANQANYKTPERRSYDLILVDEVKLGEAIPVTDAVLKQAYESSKDRYKVEERAKVRHILLKTTGMDAAGKAKMLAKAEDLLKQIRGGADFAKLAKENSEDPGSAQKGGDLDWIQHGQTVPQFEAKAFSLKAKEISSPLETMFGYHIIQTMEKENARIKPFDEVKADLAKEVRRVQIFEKMPALADQAHAELVKNPTQAQEIAKRLNLVYIKAENLAPTDPLPQVGVSRELTNALAPLPKGGVTDVVQLPENKLAVAVVSDIILQKPAPLADVEKQTRDFLAAGKAQQMAEAKAREFEARLKTNNKDFRRTAQELKVKLIETNEFERNSQMTGVGPSAYFGEQPFLNPVGSVIGLYRVASTPYFFKIVSRSGADASKINEQRDAIVTGLRDKKLRERREMFEEGLVRTLKQAGKIKVNEDAVKRLAASYKG